MTYGEYTEKQGYEIGSRENTAVGDAGRSVVGVSGTGFCLRVVERAGVGGLEMKVFG